MSSRREPWDFAAFIRQYNDIARASAGWTFDPKIEGHDPAQLKAMYERLDDHRTLQDYAERQYRYEQETGVEGSE